MKRIIKFKVWDTLDDKWREPFGEIYDFQEMLNSDRFKVCQYTGLKDKNGKEIYEGDIIEFDKKSEYCKPEYWYPIYKITRSKWSFEIEYVGGDKPSDNLFLLTQCSDTNVKVLGNIYENLELLNN